MKKLFVLLIISVMLTSCEKSAHFFIIHMKDGTTKKAWDVKSEGGGITVWKTWQDGWTGKCYMIPSDQYERVNRIGFRRK